MIAHDPAVQPEPVKWTEIDAGTGPHSSSRLAPTQYLYDLPMLEMFGHAEALALKSAGVTRVVLLTEQYHGWDWIDESEEIQEAALQRSRESDRIVRAVTRSCTAEGIRVQIHQYTGDLDQWLTTHSHADLVAHIQRAETTYPAIQPAAQPERQRFPDYIEAPYASLFYGANEVDAPLDYHWQDFVVRGSVVTILGAKKHTKSWFADLLMVSAAAKEPIFRGFPSGCQRVLLINGPRENSVHETQRRIRAIHRQYQVEPGGGEIRVLVYRRAALRLERDESPMFTELLTLIDEYKPNVIRLDSAGALWGGKNENDSAEVRTWTEKRVEVMLAHAAPQCTIYMLAHTGHAIRDGRSTFSQRHQRGASGWGDATDTLLMVEKGKAPDGSPDGLVVSTIGMEYSRLGVETSKLVQLTLSGGPSTGAPLTATLAEVMPEVVDPTDTEKALRAAVHVLQETGQATQALIYKAIDKEGRTEAGREALRVLRGHLPWPAGWQYVGTRRAMVKEDGQKNNSPVLRWIGHSGDIEEDLGNGIV